MKNILKILVVGTILFSCEEVLVESPKRIAESTFYKSVSDFESASMAMYVPLKNVYNDVYLVTLEGMGDAFIARDAMADISQYQGLKGQNRNATAPFWQNFYISILDANIILSKVNQANELTEVQKSQYAAEAKIMRAFCYFQLVRVWGRIPLRTDENMDVLEIPRSSTEDIFKLIIEDLTYGAANARENQSILGRATKWVAKSLLAEVYLTVGEYGQSATLANEVIESGKFSLVKVEEAEDFINIFGPQAKGTTEEIFYLHYSVDRPWNYLRYILNAPHYLGIAGYHMITGRHFLPFYANWDNNDLRKSFGTYDNTILDETKITYRILCRKFRDPDIQTARTDYPVYRLADLLLIYAEASCRVAKGPTEKSIEAINRIRRRAFGLDPLIPNSGDYKLSDYNENSFIELVLKEKGYETYAEGKRWFDLKRLGVYKQFIKQARDMEVSDAHLLWPIPQEEMNFNRAIDPADQNIGY